MDEEEVQGPTVGLTLAEFRRSFAQIHQRFGLPDPLDTVKGTTYSVSQNE